jgi:hypothetical protein
MIKNLKIFAYIYMLTNKFSIRKKCVICNNELHKILFNKDLEIISNPYIKDDILDDILIPYNIYM